MPQRHAHRGFRTSPRLRADIRTDLLVVAGIAAMTAGAVLVFVFGSRQIKTVIGAVRAPVAQWHELSESTRAVLGSLDSELEVRLYFSDSRPGIPAAVREHVLQVEDLLQDYRSEARGKIRVINYDPEPDSDAEDAGKLDGIEPIALKGDDSYYLGMSVSHGSAKATLPTLSPDRLPWLEYDLTSAIKRVLHTNRVVGIMSSLPVWGNTGPGASPDHGKAAASPWVFVSELKREYEVRPVALDAARIDDAVAVLALVHPAGISEGSQYAVDQFVMRGGRLLTFLDPACWAEQFSRATNRLLRGDRGSSLPKLMRAWGVSLDPTKVVADAAFTTQVRNSQGQLDELPWVLSVRGPGIKTNELLTAGIGNLLLPAAGGLANTGMQGLTSTVLLQTTRRAALLDSAVATASSGAAGKIVWQTDVNLPLAIRLTGKFRTAFPDGAPGSSESGTSLKECQGANTVILVADADMLADLFSVKSQEIVGNKVVVPINDNLRFVQAAVDFLASGLEGEPLRRRPGRSPKHPAAREPFRANRPLTAQQQEEITRSVKHLAALPLEEGTQVLKQEAAVQYNRELEKLKELTEAAQKRLGEGRAAKTADGKFVLSPEQQKLLAEFTKQQAAQKEALKLIRRRLREQTEALERLKESTDRPMNH